LESFQQATLLPKEGSDRVAIEAVFICALSFQALGWRAPVAVLLSQVNAFSIGLVRFLFNTNRTIQNWSS
jgi:hypothetical protein